MYTDPGKLVVREIIKARKEVLGDEGEVGAWYFGVDGTFINEAGIPCVGLGPGNEYLAHTPNDVVPVKDVIKAAKIYFSMIMSVCR